jgi:hypothetical protein
LRTYRILLEVNDETPPSEVRLMVRDAARAHEVAVGLLQRDGGAIAADVYEDGRRLERITRADPRQA